MRYDLAFFLCCCKSFLGSDDDHVDGGDFYSLLGISRDASQDEIKRAYKRQSLQMHPDKLAQRGMAVTEEDQARFTRMKEAYEVLSDAHKRETYDTIGARGMKWLEEPFSVDPQELAHNFATSSALDRSKIFAIFVGFAVAVLILPVLVCLHVDGVFGPNASWFATLTPLWIWNGFILFYHSRVIMMGPIARPDHIPPEEWVDPLPMKKRVFSLLRFILIVLFELLVAFKLDHFVNVPWVVIFFPLYVWEVTTLYKKLPLARMRIVTVEDLETALGKPFAEFTPAEKELIGKRYSVVSSTTSPDFDAAQKLKTRARHDIVKSMFRIVFAMLLLGQLDGHISWNWWLIFMPFWVLTALICFANYQAFAEVQNLAAERDPTIFGLKKDDTKTGGAGGYGSVGKDGEATASAAANNNKPELSEEEREELKAHVMASGSRLCSKCCSQGFFLLVVFLFLGKLQGAAFSSMWIISPILFVIGIVLCCLGCAIFGITEVPTDGVEFDTGDTSDLNTTTEQSSSHQYSATPQQTTPMTSTTIPPATHNYTAPAPMREGSDPTLPNNNNEWDPEQGNVNASQRSAEASTRSNTPISQTEMAPAMVTPATVAHMPSSAAAAVPPSAAIIPPKETISVDSRTQSLQSQQQQQQQPVDLLDDYSSARGGPAPAADSSNDPLSGSIHELD